VQRRNAALAVSLAGLVGFAVLVALVLHDPRPLPLDRALHRLALEHREPILGFAAFVTHLGTGPVILPLLLLAGVVAARRDRSWWLVPAGPVLLAAGLLVRFVAMTLIDRPRPPMQDWTRFASGTSFPSGHTTTSALGYTLLLLLLAPSLRTQLGRAALAVGLLGVAGLVGVSRVVLGVHWPTDVLGGWSLATFLLPLAALALAALDRTPSDRPPV
jgi:undecaprenyl-diphosphatase